MMPIRRNNIRISSECILLNHCLLVLSKITEASEAVVKIFPAGRDSKERAAYALECLPAPVSRFQNKSRPFLYWTIRVLVEVFTTDRLTPTEVSQFY
jgi:hypothetical protein